MKKFIAAFMGVVLVIGVLVTAKRGLSENDIAVFEQAMNERDDDYGFQGFSIADYSVAFYDGERDYVMTWEGEDYTVTKRKAVLNSIAATAYPVDEHFEVLSPTLEKMSSLLSVVGMGEMEYGLNGHASTILHEGFHCYQLTNYVSQIENICPSGVSEKDITEQIDTNSEAKELYEEMLKLMHEMMELNDKKQIKELLMQYRALEIKRNELLTQDLLDKEKYYTIVEGTARYVEAQSFKKFLPNQYEDNYLKDIDVYNDGSSKYYRMGMAQCMVLDKLNADWKNGYDFSKSMTELLYESCLVYSTLGMEE